MDPRTAQRLQAEMNEEVGRLQEAAKKLNALLSQRSKLLTQQSENEMVERELSGGGGGGEEEGEGDACVWKLIGPVLVKVDLHEAKTNVQSRLKWFKEEIGRLDAAQKEQEEARKASQEKVLRLQESARRAQQDAVQRQMGKA